ncbi:MazG-like family protein [Actinacidiphila sp. DG2A-62]|uniref:MazG-like family protein n=1 Tax=Actinacidiphila sp. DG2A-62 TaxID=3108821 RepID=UPI002DB6AD73|nr:MazG-like family protein [Actinacidiphila sp. DG2A-62]MEC3995082.1 MazG-like family protein [Actinacidiphila sp. DG2A-62]
MQEKVGEVAQATMGAVNANQCRGHSHTWEDVEAELCDVIMSSMVALATITPDAPRRFRERLDGAGAAARRCVRGRSERRGNAGGPPRGRMALRGAVGVRGRRRGGSGLGGPREARLAPALLWDADDDVGADPEVFALLAHGGGVAGQSGVAQLSVADLPVVPAQNGDPRWQGTQLQKDAEADQGGVLYGGMEADEAESTANRDEQSRQCEDNPGGQ